MTPDEDLRELARALFGRSAADPDEPPTGDDEPSQMRAFLHHLFNPNH